MPENKPSADQFAILFQAFVEGRSSKANTEQFFQLLDEPEYRLLLQDLVEAKLAQPTGAQIITEPLQQLLDTQLTHILAQPKEDKPVVRSLFHRLRWVAAAVFILIAGATGWFLLHSANEPQPITASIYHNNVAPGKVGATLKLSGNRTIDLDKVADGVIAYENGMKVIKKNGEITYEGTANTQEVIYNELIADKKQRSSAVLPDGSIAWVNASSSVKYPIHFTGSNRRVSMTGEAIFRVKHNAAQPFQVEAKGHIFEDVGTEFNINAYDDEAVIKTTVLEGEVKIGTTSIKQNQQVQINKQGQTKLFSNIETDEVFAWRDGQFNYSGTDIEEIMKQAAKWYDVEIEFKTKINEPFTILGLSRDKGLTEFLQALEQAGHVHFEVQGRKVTVKP